MRRYTESILREAARTSLSISEVMRKVGFINIAGGSHAHIKRMLIKFGIDTSHFMGQRANIGNRYGIPRKSADNILIKHNNLYKTKIHMLRRALKEIGREEKCTVCGMGATWQAKPLQLQVDHINGDIKDDRPENLRFVCPNCHSQTENYAAIKNRAKRTQRTRGKKCIACENIASYHSASGLCNKCYMKKLSSRKIRCQICGNPVKYGKRFCSYKCSEQSRHKIKWPVDLPSLVVNTSQLAVARKLGVSDKAVAKRLKNHHGIQNVSVLRAKRPL